MNGLSIDIPSVAEMLELCCAWEGISARMQNIALQRNNTSCYATRRRRVRQAPSRFNSVNDVKSAGTGIRRWYSGRCKVAQQFFF